MKLIETARQLRARGVLGMNQRNIDFIMRYNKRKFYPRVDDKLLTKRLCVEAGIPTSRLMATAKQGFELGALVRAMEASPRFALKPARGAMGNGIVVIKGRSETGAFVRAGGSEMSGADLRYHAATILSGLYSLGGQTDVAMVEEMLTVHPTLRAISIDGVPDVRVIVFLGVPVMAMIRLPTQESRGRANLHQGAIGAGIDLMTGRTVHAVLRNHPRTHHPDSGESVIGREIPDFRRVLEIATRAADETELGYVGADVVIDAERGPVILELNARPGLAVQIANHAGLATRLRQVEAMRSTVSALDDRLNLGCNIANEHPTHATREEATA
jgi:alpha-L-glutamate ligase-like protein